MSSPQPPRSADPDVAPVPLLRASRAGWQLTADAPTLARESARFAASHVLRLPSCFDAGLLGIVQRRLTADRFRTRIALRVHPPAADLKLRDAVTLGLLHFLLNDSVVLTTIREIAGEPAIGGFVGSVYRLVPGAGHTDSWHDDLDGNRLVAFTLNLSEGPFEGGEFELRQRGRTRPLQTIANSGPGDGLLFAIKPGLEHRIAPMTGRHPKTAFAGWFCRDPNLRA